MVILWSFGNVTELLKRRGSLWFIVVHRGSKCTGTGDQKPVLFPFPKHKSKRENINQNAKTQIPAGLSFPQVKNAPVFPISSNSLIWLKKGSITRFALSMNKYTSETPDGGSRRYASFLYNSFADISKTETQINQAL